MASYSSFDEVLVSVWRGLIFITTNKPHETMTIRLMQESDLDLLYTIAREAYSLNFHHHWTGDGLASYLEKVFGRELLKRPRTGKLYILPDSKGSGIGGAMVDLVFQLAREAGKASCWLAVLDANTPAIAFYEKYGFRFHGTARVPYPFFKEELRGMWRMIKKLSPIV